jgi:hypothetical protein
MGANRQLSNHFVPSYFCSSSVSFLPFPPIHFSLHFPSIHQLFFC